MVYYFDMDGVLADFHSGFTSRGLAFSYAYISTLPPFTHNVNLLNRLIVEGHTCYILTRATCEATKKAKADWLKKYVPALAADKFICLIGSSKKVDFIREEGTLIDDDIKQTRPWIKAGHAAILLKEKGEAINL